MSCYNNGGQSGNVTAQDSYSGTGIFQRCGYCDTDAAATACHHRMEVRYSSQLLLTP
jgi:hypothetical protein